MDLKRIFFLLLSLFLLTGGLWFFYQKEIQSPTEGQPSPVSFVIERGESADLIARHLSKQKLIRSPLFFRLYLWLNRLGGSLQAGVFQIPQNSSIVEVVEILQHGQADVRVTLLEGWRREEMAKYLNSKVDFGEEFLKETEGMEGYLFPDTYYVPGWFTAKQLVAMVKDNFESKLQSLQTEQDSAGQKTTLTLEEMVLLASIVERETKFPTDRPVVAGILLKRLRNDWPLETDATLQYALANDKVKRVTEAFDWWPKEITTEDLELDSPYNTRKYRGLPPTPICNPGLAALRAVFFPQENPYWFYLSDKEGQMHYAQTIEEHSQNVARYLGN